jgi:hypothetical protein
MADAVRLFPQDERPEWSEVGGYMVVSGQVEALQMNLLPADRWPDIAEFAWAENSSGTPAWFVLGVVSKLGSGLGFSQLQVVTTGESGIDTKALRGIRLGHLLPVITAQIQTQADVDQWRAAFGAQERDEQDVASTQAAADSARSGGRPSLGDDHYRRVALIYLEEVATGTRGVLQRVADRLTAELRRPIPRETVRDWVSVARNDKQFLGATKQGRATNHPGPRLQAEGNQP